ncbi:MAG: penicillin-binding protein 2 [Candidatus Dojkabacteria bacterium]|nr:penicillin-binding protein 2 [Candidatus Dojkabacteria bacterium]MDQ7021523.1 penicillin-binding protein 2 [Candidatus Dojkabacteria bacterium]
MAEIDSINIKTKWIYRIFFIFVILIAAFCIRWQVINASEFKEISDNRVVFSLKSFRGSIYAKDGSPLAFSEPRFDLYIWLPGVKFYENQNLQTRDELIRKLQPYTDMTQEELGELMTDYDEVDIGWFRIARSLTEDEWRSINSLTTDSHDTFKLQGLNFEITSERVYPEKELASQLIGLVNKEEGLTYGISGLEAYWNGDLKPKEGLVIEEADATGRAIATALVPTIEPQAGSELYTSIDIRIQRLVEKELKRIVEQYEAKSGSVVIMDPKTGEIISLANYPTYDPNTREGDENDFSNVSIYDPIEIGSIIKTITLSAAIDQGLIEGDTMILPEGHPGYVYVADDFGLDGNAWTWDRNPQGPMNAETCFIKSDNVCFIEIGRLMEDKSFYDYLYKFGLGEISGIDLVGESNGVLKSYEDWDLADEATFTYGHGLSVNMVQATSMVAVIPNRGVRMQPHIVTKVVKDDGEVQIMDPTPVAEVISERTAIIMMDIMKKTYQNNITESYYMHLKDYNVGWKTGSALIADPNNLECPYCTGLLNNSIIGFDASPNPKFVMSLRLEEPNGGLSYYNVRPAWLDIFNVIKDELGMMPLN